MYTGKQRKSIVWLLLSSNFSNTKIDLSFLFQVDCSEICHYDLLAISGYRNLMSANMIEQFIENVNLGFPNSLHFSLLGMMCFTQIMKSYQR